MALKVRLKGEWVPVGVGRKGEKGLKGEKGNKGEKGEKGLKGDKSDVKGDKGEKGEKGDGIKGEKGAQGPQGNDGDSVKGEKGDEGQKGQKGEFKGEKGEKGDVEAQGNKGDQGDKGSKGDVEAQGNKGDQGEKGQKGEFKGEKGDAGDVEAKGNKGDKGEFKGEKGVPGDVEAKGNKGQKGEFKGDKGTPGNVEAKGAKGEPGAGAITINDNANNRVLTATGLADEIQAESKLQFDGQGRLDIYAGTGDSHIELGLGANNQYAYLDLIGNVGTPGGDYGARFLRGNTGANTFSQVAHRGTGELQLSAVDNGAMKFFGNHFGFRNTARIINSLNGYGSANSGFRLITNVFTGWPYNGTAYSYDTGISVNQGNGAGCLLVIYSNTHNPGYNGEHALYLVRLWESGNNSAGVHTIYESSGFYKATFSKSSQNTVVITGQKGGNYVTIMAMGGVVL